MSVSSSTDRLPSARVPLLNLAHGYAHFSLLLFPALASTVGEEFSRSFGEVIVLATPAFAAFGIGALPAGWLGDRMSRALLISIFFLGVGASSLLAAMATSTLFLMLALTGIGIFGSIYHPVGTAMVVEGRKRVGRALGINSVCGNLGVAMGPLGAGLLLAVAGWREAFVLSGVLGLTMGLAFLFLVPRNPPKRSSGDTAHDHGLARKSLLLILAVIGIATLFGGVMFDAMNVSLPKLFEERLSSTSSSAGLYVGMILMAASFIQYPVGLMVDRTDPKRIFLLVIAARIPLFWLVTQASGALLLVPVLLLMMMVFAEVPVFDTLLARLVADEWRARAYAIRNFLGFAVGVVSIPLVAFSHGTAAGFNMLFFILMASNLVLVGIVAFMPRSGARAGQAQGEPGST